MRKDVIFKFVSVFGALWLVLAWPAKAQEYKHEVGAAVGASSYMGDANKTALYRHPGIVGGFMYRYNLNFHWAVKANLFAGNVSGSTKNSGNVFPHGQEAAFKRWFVDGGAQVEFNFFPYSDKYAYLSAKPYTPYLLVGVGTTFAGGEHSFFNVNVPVGVGFKYKIKNRVNIGIEFSMRKLFGDDFDAPENNAEWSLNNPYGIESSFLKNKDWYSLTMIHLTWDFGLRKDPCCP